MYFKTNRESFFFSLLFLLSSYNNEVSLRGRKVVCLKQNRKTNQNLVEIDSVIFNIDLSASVVVLAVNRVHDLVETLLFGLFHGLAEVVPHAKLFGLARLDQVQSFAHVRVRLAEQTDRLASISQTTDYLVFGKRFLLRLFFFRCAMFQLIRFTLDFIKILKR